MKRLRDGGLSETIIQRQIMDWLSAKGYFFYRNNNITVPGRAFVGKRGVADIVAILPVYRDGEALGVYLGIEAKSAKGKQSEHQTQFESDITRIGGKYVLAHSLEEFLDKFIKLTKDLRC